MQGAKLNEFVAELKENGLARTNRFALTMNLPSAFPASGGANPYTGNTSLRLATLLAENVQLPGFSYNTIQNRVFGEYRETPYERMFDNIQVSFYVDRKMKVKKLFDSWIQSIQRPTSREFNYYNSYTTNMQIYVNDTLNQCYYGAALYEVYPKAVAPITLDQNSKDIMKINVTLQYKYWVPISISNRSNLAAFDTPSLERPTPTDFGPQPVEQVPMWQDAWNDVNEWLGNPTIPDFNVNGSDVGTLREFIGF